MIPIDYNGFRSFIYSKSLLLMQDMEMSIAVTLKLLVSQSKCF